MSRLIVKGDIGKVAQGIVTEQDLFHVVPAEFGIGGGAVTTGREHALECMCDATMLFENVYVCKLNEHDQIKATARDMDATAKGFYTPLFACYGYDAPMEVRNYSAASTQARFLEDVIWKQHPEAIALSVTATVKITREGFAGSAINGSVAKHRSPDEKPNEFNPDPLMHWPDFREGYMWFNGISADIGKNADHPVLKNLDRAFYYLKGLEPKGSYKHHFHGLITEELPAEWLDDTDHWPTLDASARRFLDTRNALDDFPVHVSDHCKIEIIKAAVWVHGEGDIEYTEAE